MNKMRKICVIVMAISALLLYCSGCGSGQMLYGEDAKCEIFVTEDIVVNYKECEYTVLEEEVEAEQIGELTGYIYKNINGLMFSTVYMDEKNNDEIQIAIDDSFYKAVKTELLSEEQVPLALPTEDAEELFPKQLTVNEENATQLIGDGVIYQVMEETVEEENIGSYLTSISTSVVFDNVTKEVLPNEEYIKIDWSGETSNAKSRTLWIYTHVYKVKEQDYKTIAVNINGEYYEAELVEDI